MAQAQRILPTPAKEIDFIPREFYGGASPRKKMAKLSIAMAAVEDVFAHSRDDLTKVAAGDDVSKAVAALTELAEELTAMAGLAEEAAWRVSVCSMAQEKRAKLSAQLKLIGGLT